MIATPAIPSPTRTAKRKPRWRDRATPPRPPPIPRPSRLASPTRTTSPSRCSRPTTNLYYLTTFDPCAEAALSRFLAEPGPYCHTVLQCVTDG
jgi:hypothetical protein